MDAEVIEKKSKTPTKPKNKYVILLVSFISTSFDLIRSILIRLVFCIHLLVAVCLVCYVKNDLWYFVNSVGVVFIVIEWFAITLKHKGKDLEWFSPSFFIYIISIIPPTWFLELENIHYKQNSFEFFSNETKNQFLFSSLIENVSSIESIQETIGGIPIIPLLALPDTNFAMYIEVTMMFIVILGRWIMPKKGMTRSELSQLLLVYMSLASDIIDLLSVLQEQKVYMNSKIVYVTLSIYSWSLFQFTLNLVAARGRPSVIYSDTMSFTSAHKANHMLAKTNLALHNELYNVIITLFMQDFPFFVLRIYCVLEFRIVSYLFLFFLFKNGIIFSLQFYRMIAILVDKDFSLNVTDIDVDCQEDIL